MEIDGFNYGEQIQLSNWMTNQLPLVNPDLSFIVSSDNWFYSIANTTNENRRLKIYTSDGSPMFTTPIEDVGNPTYAELPGRIGFEVCLAVPA